MDDEKPSTKHLVLKPKEIVPMDTLARPGDGKAISVQLIHKQNELAEQRAAAGKKKKQQPSPLALGATEPPLSPVFKPKDIVPMDQPAHPDDEEAITVPDILLQNRIAELESGWGRIRHKRRRLISRRTRDFLLVVGLADFAIVCFMKKYMNAVSMVYGISAVTLLSTTVAWVMFVVMDDY
jgi:hypothetical protein